MRAAALSALLAAACAPAGPSGRDAAGPGDPITFSIVTTTDVHGAAREMALVASYVANLRAASGGRVLWLDGGDMWQGTLVSGHFLGEPVVHVMNAVGVDAAALGNHELDWGRDVFLQRAAECRFPILSANVVRAADGERPGWDNVAPYAVLAVPGAGVTVGVIGLSTLDTPTYQRGGVLADLDFRPLAEAVKEWAPRVREAGADVVVVLVHEGGRCDDFSDPEDLSSCEPDSKLFRLVRDLSPRTVDLVVGGHSHRNIAHVVNGIPVLQAGAKAAGFGRADVTWDPAQRRVADVRIFRPERAREGARYAGATVVPAAAALAALAPYERRVESLRTRPVGAEAATSLTRAHAAESELGDLIADALRASVPGAHVGLQNSGGIRADIDEGPIDYGEVYDVVPFDNRVAVMRLTGAQLRALLADGASGEHGVLQLSGVRVVVDARRAGCPGLDPLDDVRIDDGTAAGAPLDPGGDYVIATSDYLAQGGSGWTFLTDTLPPEAVDVKTDLLRDVVADHLRRLAQVGPVDPPDRPILDPARPRIRIHGSDQYRAACAGAPR